MKLSIMQNQAAIAVSSPLNKLAGLCSPSELGSRLLALDRFLAADVATVGADLDRLPSDGYLVQTAATTLVQTKGKLLRPMCVALASRCGTGFDQRAATLAVAVEMVHNATLLHDDVVDEATLRRGKPTARALYGNACSIFAGDWLLVSALQKINASGYPDLVAAMLAIIEEMVLAESLQLQRRGHFDKQAVDEQAYLEVATGKTAALFRWAMLAGATAGGLGQRATGLLQAFGKHLGIAFQVIDDCLDFTGSAAELGKQPLADLREGKLTYPLLIATAHQPALLPLLAEFVANNTAWSDEAFVMLARDAAKAIASANAIEHAKQFAYRQIESALDCLAELPASEAKHHLNTVALASLQRSK